MNTYYFSLGQIGLRTNPFGNNLTLYLDSDFATTNPAEADQIFIPKTVLGLHAYMFMIQGTGNFGNLTVQMTSLLGVPLPGPTVTIPVGMASTILGDTATHTLTSSLTPGTRFLVQISRDGDTGINVRFRLVLNVLVEE